MEIEVFDRALRTAPTVLAALVLTAVPVTRAARAQEIPGADTETAGHLEAEYLAYVIANVDTLMTGWRSAWSSGDDEGIANLYAENALLIPNGGAPIVGRESIRRHYERSLQSAGDIGVSLGDIGAGEEMAYQFGDYRFVDTSGDAVAQVFGRHVTIPMRYGRDWRIRAQLLLPASGSRRPISFAPAAADLTPLDLNRLGPSAGRTGGRRSHYRRRAFTATSAVLAKWRDSWHRDDLAEALESFSEETLLVLPGEEPRFGLTSIRRRLSDLLPAIGALHTTILDFEASGGMSFAYGRYFCECRRDHGGDVLGHYLSVLTADGSDWRIRTLVLWIDMAEADGGAG